MASPGAFSFDGHSDLTYPTLSSHPENSGVELVPTSVAGEEEEVTELFPFGHDLLSRAPNGWVTEVQENLPLTLTLPSPSLSPEPSAVSSAANPILLANTAGFPAHTGHPYPFSTLSHFEESSSEGTRSSTTLDDAINIPIFQIPQYHFSGPEIPHAEEPNQIQQFFWLPPMEEFFL